MTDKKITLLYDATIVANGASKNAARSGIYFVALNVLKELLKRNDINLKLYCDQKSISGLNKVFESTKEFQNLTVINNYKNIFLSEYRAKLKEKRNELKAQNKKIQRFLLSIFMFLVCDIPLKLSNFIFNTLIFSVKIKNYDLFLSPVFATIPAVKRNKKIKSFVIIYDTIPLLFKEYYPEMNKGNYWFGKLLESIRNNEQNGYFAISECTKQDFLKFIPTLKDEDVSVPYIAADDRFSFKNDTEKILKIKEKYNIPTDKKYIFSLCTLEPRKNLLFAVKNFIKFVDKYNNDDLLFVLGGGHWDTFIKQLETEVENLGDYKNRIIKAGYIDDEDLPYLYSDSMFLIYPSIYEGFGLPILEAMMCKVPVITSNVSSMPEVIGDCGIQIDPNDDEACINAIKTLYENEDLRNELAQKGYERSKMFNWEKCVNLMIEKMKTYCK